jgi:hypothetical protein
MNTKSDTVATHIIFSESRIIKLLWCAPSVSGHHVPEYDDPTQ